VICRGFDSRRLHDSERLLRRSVVVSECEPEINDLALLVSGDPRVMTRWDVDGVTGPELDGLAVVHLKANPAGDAVDEVSDDARLGRRPRP